MELSIEKRLDKRVYAGIAIYIILSSILWFSRNHFFLFLKKQYPYAKDLSPVRIGQALNIFDKFALCTFAGLFMILFLFRKIGFKEFAKYQLTLTLGILISSYAVELFGETPKIIFSTTSMNASFTLIALYSTVSIMVIIYMMYDFIASMLPLLIIYLLVLGYAIFDFIVQRGAFFLFILPTHKLNVLFALFCLLMPILYAFLLERHFSR